MRALPSKQKQNGKKVDGPEKPLQISFLEQGLRFRRTIHDYFCCILTVPSMPTGVVILVCYDTLTRRKELAVKPNIEY